MSKTSKTELDMFDLGSFITMDPATATELRAAANGGSDTKKYFERLDQHSAKIRALAEHIDKNPSSAWNEGKLADGTPIQYAEAGGSSIMVIPQDIMDKATARKLEATKHDVSKAKTRQTVLIRYNTPEMTAWSKMLVLGVDLVGPVPIVKLITKGLSTLFSLFVRRGVTQAVSTNGASAIEAAMQDNSALIRFASWAQGRSTGALLVRWTSRIGLWIAVAYTLNYLLENVVLRRYVLRIMVFNLTDCDLEVTTPYHYNSVNEEAVESTRNHVLDRVMNRGDHITVGGIPITQESLCVATASLIFCSESEFLKGIGALVQLKNQKQEDSEFQNVVATATLPRVGYNSISVWFDEGRTDFENLYNGEEGKNKVLKISEDKGPFKAVMTMSELVNAGNNTYYSSLYVVDTRTYENYKDL